MTDLQEGLLVGKGKKQAKQYKRRFDECEQRLKILRNKNNQLQKNMNEQMESDIRHAVRQQGQLLQKDIKDLKTLISNLSNDYTDQISKNKIKDLLKMVSTQVQRNKRIVQQFAVRASTASFMKKSALRNGKGKQHSNTKKGQKKMDSEYSSQGVIQKEGGFQQSDQMDQQQMQLQQRIMKEKAAILKQIEQKNNKINQLYNDMADIVGGEQRDMVNQIDNNIVTAEENIIQANVELDEARIQQKKAKKKYICLSVTIILAIIFGGILIYFFLR